MPTWILVADTSRARIFVADKSAGPLNEIRTLAYPEARLHEGDLVADKGGRDRSPGIASHGFDGTDSHKHDNAERFAAQVCSELESARTAGALRKLYVVAAPGFLGMLRRHQSGPLRQLIVSEIDKNLSTQDPVAIRKCLPDYL
jgi:protein required for attachment to host cells